MFYDNYLRLCNSVGKSPSAVALEIGIEKSTVTRWKQGKSQTDANIRKVADYFGVPVSELTEEKEKAPTTDGERIPHRDKRELLAGRGVSILLDADAKLTEDQLDDIINFIQFQQEKNGR